jgi:tellurite resistance protein TehA-like permease
VLAVAICFHMSYNMLVLSPRWELMRCSVANSNRRMSNRKSDLSKMTALWLIPVVSVVIAASSGALIAAVLPDPDDKLLTLIISYVLWGIGFPLALVIMVLYFLRLTIYEPPIREVIVSIFLPIGPLGLGAFS